MIQIGSFRKCFSIWIRISKNDRFGSFFWKMTDLDLFFRKWSIWIRLSGISTEMIRIGHFWKWWSNSIISLNNDPNQPFLIFLLHLRELFLLFVSAQPLIQSEILEKNCTSARVWWILFLFSLLNYISLRFNLIWIRSCDLWKWSPLHGQWPHPEGPQAVWKIEKITWASVSVSSLCQF